MHDVCTLRAEFRTRQSLNTHALCEKHTCNNKSLKYCKQKFILWMYSLPWLKMGFLPLPDPLPDCVRDCEDTALNLTITVWITSRLKRNGLAASATWPITSICWSTLNEPATWFRQYNLYWQDWYTVSVAFNQRIFGLSLHRALFSCQISTSSVLWCKYGPDIN